MHSFLRLEMKNPHQLNKTWNSSTSKDGVVISVPAANKKFKRKSREPKRLFSRPEPKRMSCCPVDMSDDDTMEVSGVGSSASMEIQSLKGNMAVSQSGAIDMRIGLNVPAITSKLPQLPTSPFSQPEISHWPTAISQPLSGRLKLGLRSALPLSELSSGRNQVFNSLDPSLPDHRTSQKLLEPEVQSPKVGAV